jgi:hypothetical protein
MGKKEKILAEICILLTEVWNWNENDTSEIAFTKSETEMKNIIENWKR